MYSYGLDLFSAMFWGRHHPDWFLLRHITLPYSGLRPQKRTYRVYELGLAEVDAEEWVIGSCFPIASVWLET